MRRPSQTPLQAFFSGRKGKWLPLYQRLLARSKDLAAQELRILRSCIRIGSIGSITVHATDGLTLSLKVDRTTRKIPLTGAAQIDEDLLLWIRAAALYPLKRKRAKASARKGSGTRRSKGTRKAPASAE